MRTGGVERSCTELPREGQLRTYLQQALANERVLLDREDAKVRLEKRRHRDLSWLDKALAEQKEGADVEGDQEEGET